MKYNSTKQTTQNTATQNYPGLIASYETGLGNEMGLFYNAPQLAWGDCCILNAAEKYCKKTSIADAKFTH